MKKFLSIILATIIIFAVFSTASAQTMESTLWGVRFTLSDNWTQVYDIQDGVHYTHNWGPNEDFIFEYVDLGYSSNIYECQEVIDNLLDWYLSNSTLASNIVDVNTGVPINPTITEKFSERKYETYNGIVYYRAKKAYTSTRYGYNTQDFYQTIFATVQYGKLFLFEYECEGTQAPHLDDVKAVLNNVRYADEIGSFYRVGDVIGSALKTDIVAAINGHQIPSYNVDGYTYIVAEDLRYYGFSVLYDNYSRSLSISRDYSQGTVSKYYIKPYVAKSQVGIKEHNLLYTDITTYLDGYYTPSYNINGQTIIRFDSLQAYGNVNYDNYSRTMSLSLQGIR